MDWTDVETFVLMTSLLILLYFCINSGNESQLSDCPHVGFGNVKTCHDRGHHAGVICFDQTGKQCEILVYVLQYKNVVKCI